MERVKSLEQYSALIKEVRQTHSSVQTNCYMLPDAVEKQLSKNKLFALDVGAGIALIIDEGAFYQLYYYVGLNETILFDRKDKPVILDQIYLQNKKTESVVQIEKKWLDCGFHNYKTYRHITLKMTQEQLDGIPLSLDDENYVMVKAKPSDTEAVSKLWTSSLDVLSTALPEPEEISELIEQGLVFCARSEASGKIGAVMKLEYQRGVYLIHHVVVDSDHRRQGLAKRLYDYCYRLTGTEGTQYYGWVDVNNIPSLQLHLSKGWKFNGRLTSQLLLDSK